MKNIMTILANHRKSIMAVLVIALLAATLFATGGTVSANDTTATDLGNWDNNTTTGRDGGESLGSSNIVNYYKFVLTQEKYADITATEQDHPHAKLEIVDADDNTIFEADRAGLIGSSNHYERLSWTVIGPGTWYIKTSQTVTNGNDFDLTWKIKNAPAFPNDDFAAGIWTPGIVEEGGSTDGTIASLSEYDDYDWFALELENWGQYKITVKPRGSNNDQPSMILRDAYGQFIKFSHEGKIHLDTRASGPPE